MKIKFHDAASRELEEASAYYRSQAKALGIDFQRKTKAVVQKAALPARNIMVEKNLGYLTTRNDSEYFQQGQDEP